MWLTPLVTSASPIVPLLLKLAYNGCPLKFSGKEGLNYVDDKGEMGKLRTARGKKISQVIGRRHVKVLLAAGQMTFDHNDQAIALSSGSKNPVWELAVRVMDQTRKDPESVIVQDPWF